MHVVNISRRNPHYGEQIKDAQSYQQISKEWFNNQRVIDTRSSRVDGGYQVALLSNEKNGNVIGTIFQHD